MLFLFFRRNDEELGGVSQCGAMCKGLYPAHLWVVIWGRVSLPEVAGFILQTLSLFMKVERES